MACFENLSIEEMFKEFQIEKKVLSDVGVNVSHRIDDLMNYYIISMATEFALTKSKQDQKYSNITKNLFSLLKDRLKYVEKGFVIINDKGEIEKEINSPGQLGIVIFQILNDAIEMQSKEEQISIENDQNLFRTSVNHTKGYKDYFSERL